MKRKGRFVLERERRLSDSLLWRLQRSFFDRQGVRAWTEAVVPHYVTSNPWIADSYARVVLGWLRDWSAEPLDLDHPVHVVELGCGSGRFAYLFLVRFFDLLSRSPLAGLPVRYVLTDFTEYNLDVLRSHPSLQPFVEAGLLDFACYDAGRDLEVRLSHSGDVLAPGAVANPVAVLANYVFDSLPQDLFTLRAGRLHEGLVALTSPRRERDLDDPGLLSRVELTWTHRPCGPGAYGDPDLDGLLDEYARTLGETAILVPVASLRSVANLARLAGDRLLLLSGDKGYSSAASLAGRAEPAFALHGSFSLPVNFHAIGRWFTRRGGEFLASSCEAASLNVSAGLLGEPAGGWIETRLAFDDAVERHGPDDFFSTKQGIEASYGNLSLEQLLAWLRLSGWDHNIFLGCIATLLARVPEASEGQRAELAEAARRVWETYFPLREPSDLAFGLGLLALALERPAEALEYFHHSLRLYGDRAATSFHLALCHHRLGEAEAARERVEAALEKDPDFKPARALKAQISGEGRARS